MIKDSYSSKGLSNKVQNNLCRIKGNIKDWHDYFKHNFDHFNDFRKFVFETSLSQADIDTLKERGFPQLEFNIQEAFISRLRGEFAKQEPTLTISAMPNPSKPVDADLIDLLERHIRAIMIDSNRDNLQYNVMTDILSGGFSAMKVLTKYISPMSFEQEAILERVFDPTLMVFDKMARASHKGDGRFSAENFPMDDESFKSEYGTHAYDRLSAGQSGSLGDFRWSYNTDSGKRIILVSDYYEKKLRKEKIVQVAGMGDFPAQVMIERDYEKFADRWVSERIEQVPTIIGKSRKTDIETIDRYVLCGDSILEHTKTDWRYLPHIFVDGNSLNLRKSVEGSSYQLTRSFLYHTKGVQRLKNFAGISLANELENTMQHKLMMAIESIPSQYTDQLIDIQKASVIVFRAYSEDNPDKPLPAPIAAPRAQIPPEIIATFSACDQMMQTILGSYDASLGINNNQLSGTAISNASMQSNPVSMPFMVSYMSSLTQAGTILLDLIPKYMNTPRSIPITDQKGKRAFVDINSKDGIKMEYDSHSLELNIEAGVSFEMQRSNAFNMLTNLMQISPQFQQFMTQGAGIEILLDNIDIRGIDRIKGDVEKFVQEQKQKEQQAMQMQQQKMQADMQAQQQQINPMQIKMAEMQQKAQKDSKEIDIKQQDVDIKSMLAQSEIANQKMENLLRMSKIEARNARTNADLEIKANEGKHSRAMEVLNLHHANENRVKDREHKNNKGMEIEIELGDE